MALDEGPSFASRVGSSSGQRAASALHRLRVADVRGVEADAERARAGMTQSQDVLKVSHIQGGRPSSRGRGFSRTGIQWTCLLQSMA